MTRFIVFETDRHGSVHVADKGTCDRCGREKAEVVRFEADDDFYNLQLCAMSCWPQLVEAIQNRRKLEKPGD